MLLKYFFDPSLAHASYLVGCQRSGEAVVVDPGRDVQQYLDAAKKEGMRITGVAETHIHADYVSGAREMADQHRASLFVSDAGPADWKYEYARNYPHQFLNDGDVFQVGKIEFQAIHTPGHTPESISFMLTDRGGGANKPMGLFTGDFIFVGSIGRPDLLEKAAAMAGTAEAGARALFHSVEKFKLLPDYLQLWPAHGAGSACGKGLGAIPSSTVGYEKMFNPGLQIDEEQEFVDYILADQPEAPRYFVVMKRVNKVGPEVIGKRPLPEKLEASNVVLAAAEHMVIDTGSDKSFANGHVKGSISIPTGYLAAWAGWLVDYERPVSLITSAQGLTEAVRVLRKIGIDQIAGYYDWQEVADAGWRTEGCDEVTPEEISPAVQNGDVVLIDVRGESEWKERHIAKAQRCFLADLPKMVAGFSGDCTLVFQCRSGGRSAIAASIAQAAGVKNVRNLKGGINAWVKAGLPVAEDGSVCGPDSAACAHEAALQGQAVFWNAQCPIA